MLVRSLRSDQVWYIYIYIYTLTLSQNCVKLGKIRGKHILFFFSFFFFFLSWRKSFTRHPAHFVELGSVGFLPTKTSTVACILFCLGAPAPDYSPVRETHLGKLTIYLRVWEFQGIGDLFFRTGKGFLRRKLPTIGDARNGNCQSVFFQSQDGIDRSDYRFRDDAKRARNFLRAETIIYRWETDRTSLYPPHFFSLTPLSLLWSSSESKEDEEFLCLQLPWTRRHSGSGTVDHVVNSTQAHAYSYSSSECNNFNKDSSGVSVYRRWDDEQLRKVGTYYAKDKIVEVVGSGLPRRAGCPNNLKTRPVDIVSLLICLFVASWSCVSSASAWHDDIWKSVIGIVAIVDDTRSLEISNESRRIDISFRWSSDAGMSTTRAVQPKLEQSKKNVTTWMIFYE